MLRVDAPLQITKVNITIMTLEINQEYVNFSHQTPYCVFKLLFWKASRENQTSLLSRYDTKTHFFAHMIMIILRSSRALNTVPNLNFLSKNSRQIDDVGIFDELLSNNTWPIW